MIERYTREKMGKIWTEENKFKTWLRVEVAVLKAKAELGLIPKEIVERIERKLSIFYMLSRSFVERIKEKEKETGHDMEAFLQVVTEKLSPEEKPCFHAGLTSYDIEDTALALLFKESLNILIDDINEFLFALKERAMEYKYTLEIGRTHGVHAEPISFGFKLLNWYDEMQRQRDRLFRLSTKVMTLGKISGAVGTYANINPQIEKLTCRKLGLSWAKISTQIISRDRHSDCVTTLAVIAGTLDKIATEIRSLQRTEILEVQEPFKRGQKGSSAMPHKKNPVGSENISSLARMMRGYALVAQENQLTWHERDLTNSANERIILPDSSILLDYMLNRLKNIIANLGVYPEKMRKNLELTKGVIFSQQVMLALAEKGMGREDAHTFVQEIALEAWDKKISFEKLLLENKQVRKLLTEEEINRCLDPETQLKYIDEIFERFGI